MRTDTMTMQEMAAMANSRARRGYVGSWAKAAIAGSVKPFCHKLTVDHPLRPQEVLL